MSQVSDHLEDQWLGTIESGTSYSATSTYIALFTSDPTDSDAGTEVSGGSYARQQVNQDGATQPYWNAPAATGTGPDEITNNGAITFPTATADWGTVSHFGVYDASTGGNLLYHDNIRDSGGSTTTKTVTTDDTFEFADGNLSLRLD